MKAEKYFDQIQNFLENKMTDTEVQAFEAEMAQDAELREAVQIHRLANDAIELTIEENLRSELKTLSRAGAGAEDQSRGGRVVSLRRRLFAFSAAAAVLLVLGIFGWWYGQQNYTDQALAQQYFMAASDLGQVRNGDPASTSPLNQGYQLLREGRLEAAVDFFSQVQDGTVLAEAQYYLGIALFRMDDYDEALNAFDRVLALGNVRFLERAEYRKMLTLFAAGRDREAEALMEQILSNPDHYAYPDTQALKESRENIWGRLF